MRGTRTIKTKACAGGGGGREGKAPLTTACPKGRREQNLLRVELGGKEVTMMMKNKTLARYNSVGAIRFESTREERTEIFSR